MIRRHAGLRDMRAARADWRRRETGDYGFRVGDTVCPCQGPVKPA